MNNFKKFLTLVFALTMCLLASIPVFAQNDLGVSYTATLDQSTLEVSENDQTVVLTVKADRMVSLDAITAQAKVPAGLKLAGLSNSTLNFTNQHINISNGMISWYWGYDDGNDNATADHIATVTYTVPANTSAGTYEIEFDIIMLSSDWGTQWEFGETVTATLTITEASTHTCELIHVPGQAATCLAAGNSEYWYCSDTSCGKFYFDAAGTAEITDKSSVVLPVDADNHASDEFTYTHNGTSDAPNSSTHTKKHKCCGVTADAAEMHTYENNTCTMCGGFLVNFYDSDGTSPAILSGTTSTTWEVPANMAIELPYVDTYGKTGHQFSHWTNSINSNVKYEGNPPEVYLTQPLDFIQVWAPNTYEIYWYVDNTLHATTNVQFNENVVLPTEPAKDSYTFQGWFTGMNGTGTEITNETVFDTVPGDNSSVSYYAYFTATTYTITWTVNGEEYTTTDVAYGEAITAPAYTAADGYSFSGWTVPETMPAENLTLDATLTAKTYTITIYGMDEETVIYTVDIPYNTKIWETADKDAILGYYGTTLECIGLFAKTNPMANYLAFEDVTMPAKNMEWQGYWTGWKTDNVGTQFINYNEVLKEGWCQPAGDGSWYYLDPETGYRAENVTRVPYPTEEIDGITYAANAEDVSYAENNADSKYSDAETAVFYFDADGKFQSTYTGIVDGNRYAVNGMVAWHVGMMEIDGAYYYFKGDEEGNGNVMATGKVYVSRSDSFEDGYYFFGDDGKLCEYEGVQEVDGTLVYFENSRLASGAGLVEIDGDYYYVRSNGAVVASREYWVAKVNGLPVNVGLHTFAADGKMNDPIDTNPNYDGIVEIDGVLYYYEDGQRMYSAGVLEMTDDEGETFYIYVRSNGQLATGTYWPTNRNGLLDSGAYDWGTDGKYYPKAN